MHSFHPSRGRILFEVVCAFAISASCVGAWMQTGASALLPAAAVAALCGFVHLFDLAGRQTSVAVEPQRIDFATDRQDSLADLRDDGVPPPVADWELEPDNAIEAAEPVEPASPRASKGRRAKTPRKGRARSASAPPEAMATEPASEEEGEVAVPAPYEEAAYSSPTPLFEPEPFARQRHAVFGRKSG